MISVQPEISSSPVFILNGHSIHVEEAKAHITRIARECGAETEVIITKRGYDITSLAARAVSERTNLDVTVS